jgi:arylamine N-acetyltransferase
MSQRHIFTPDELNAYFDRVCLPISGRHLTVTHLSDAAKLAYLRLLQKHQLVKVPWENLSQHYSWHHTVHVSPQHLFRKIVTENNNRGGYCFEANYFFHYILLSLGFVVYLAGSRVHRGNGEYGGWTHVVNLITIAGKKYMVDGGYGPSGPVTALPLEDGVVKTQVAPAEYRLVYKVLAQNLDRGQRSWVYEFRYDAGSEWMPCYCFTEYEFFPADIEGLNLIPGTARNTFFTHKVVAVRFTTDNESVEGSSHDTGPRSPGEEQMDAEITGSITLTHDTLKWRQHGQKVVHVDLDSEGKRVKVLREYFSIELSREDQMAVKGTAADLDFSLHV